VRAVFELAPDVCRDTLKREFGIDGSHCAPLGLEEMFIELVGEGS
jgi:hypothetical protein